MTATAEKSSHTPGWRVEGSVYEHMAAEIVGERGIAQVWAGPHAMEYASLIAAAPDLLTKGQALANQLRAVMYHLNGQAYSSTLSALNDFDAALAKASRP